jgi:phosphohistidine phosphatase
MDLYLVRHAIAEPRDSTWWPDDALRPLSADGVELFRIAARGLRRVGVHVEAVLASPCVRAWQTAELLAEEAGWPIPEESAELQPSGGLSECVTLVKGRPESSVALIGHEPQLSELASLFLSGSDSSRFELKKGGVIWFRFEGEPQVGEGLLRGSISPKILRRLGS